MRSSDIPDGVGNIVFGELLLQERRVLDGHRAVAVDVGVTQAIARQHSELRMYKEYRLL